MSKNGFPYAAMDEVLCVGRTLPAAYHKALMELKFAPVVDCPEWGTVQKEISMTIFVAEPLSENRISRLFFGDPVSLEQYRQEMLDGILDFEVERGNWSYTYHSRYVGQYQFVVDELKRDPYSRRAVMDIRTPDDIGSPDPACWQHVQYFIRDGKLHCKVLFRSNDACKAAFMNAFALICLQERIAGELGVEVGTYTHRANSFHCYARDFDMLEGYCARILSAMENATFGDGADDESLTYSYEDDWAEQMEDAKAEIARKVEDLKNKV